LNDGVRTYLSPQVEGFAQHTLFRTYPNEQTPGLRVSVPTAEYMLAMKLMALRIEPGTDRNDFVDIRSRSVATDDVGRASRGQTARGVVRPLACKE
jgi:hypothetical protein